MDLGNLLSKKTTATLDYMGEKVTITYKPNLITQELLLDEAVTVGQTLVMVLTEWDIYETKNKRKVKLPISAKSIERLPPGLVRALFTTVLKGQTDLGEDEAS